MICRVADCCFWLGRYLERADSTARVLAVTQNLALDAELTPLQCWLPVIIALGQQEHFLQQFDESKAGDGELIQHYMSFAEDNSTSIQRSVASARFNARSIREALSLETWETVNQLHLWLASAAASHDFATNRYGFYRQVRTLAQLCLGLTQSTMLHDTPLDFIWFGVLLERIGQTARTLDVHHHAFASPLAHSIRGTHQVVETALWLSLLRACSGFEPFMKLHQGRVSGHAVVRFLMFEPRFPRSIHHGIHAAYLRLCDIRPPDQVDLPGGQSLERLRLLDQWIAQQATSPFDPFDIHQNLTHVVDETAEICNAIAHELLGYGPPTSNPVLTP